MVGLLFSIKNLENENIFNKSTAKINEKQLQLVNQKKLYSQKKITLGTQLLLQYMFVKKILIQVELNKNNKEVSWNYLNVEGVWDELNRVSDFTITYGSHGKPMIQEYPSYFNISHSKEYVFIILDNQYIGIDIQAKKREVTTHLVNGVCGT